MDKVHCSYPPGAQEGYSTLLVGGGGEGRNALDCKTFEWIQWNVLKESSFYKLSRLTFFFPVCVLCRRGGGFVFVSAIHTSPVKEFLLEIPLKKCDFCFLRWCPRGSTLLVGATLLRLLIETGRPVFVHYTSLDSPLSDKPVNRINFFYRNEMTYKVGHKYKKMVCKKWFTIFKMIPIGVNGRQDTQTVSHLSHSDCPQVMT